MLKRSPSQQTQRAQRPQRGFTLMEVLVAIAVFAVVAGISYGTLDSYIDQRERLVTHYGKLEKMQRLFILLERDFQSILQRPINTGSGYDPAIVTGNNGFLITMTISEIDYNSVLGSALKRVAWSLDGGDITRTVWDALDVDSSYEPDERIIEKDVANLSFEYRFYDPNARSTTSESDVPSGDHPDGIEVTISMDSGQEYVRLFAVPRKV